MEKIQQMLKCVWHGGLVFVMTGALTPPHTHTDPSALIQATFHFTHSSDSESTGAHSCAIPRQIDSRPQLGDCMSNRLAPTVARFHVKSISAHSWMIACQIDWRPQLRDSPSNRLAPTYGRFPFKLHKSGKWHLAIPGMLCSVGWQLVTEVSGATYRSHCRGSWAAWPFKMRTIGCPATSANTYPSTMCNIPEDQIYIYTAAKVSNHAKQRKRNFYLLCALVERLYSDGHEVSTLYIRETQIFQKCSSHFKTLGVRIMTWNEFHNQDPQILGSTVQTFVVTATMPTGFVYPCSRTISLREAELRFHYSPNFSRVRRFRKIRPEPFKVANQKA